MDFKNEKNITIFEHPLIQHKISILRDKNTGTNEFRKLVEEIAMLEGFEALGDLPLQDVEIETPIEKCMTPMISGRKLAIVPILRAALAWCRVCLPSYHLQRLDTSVCTGMRRRAFHMSITASFRIRLMRESLS